MVVCQGFPGAGQPCEGAQGLWLLQVITPFRKLILCAENRKEMEDWISALKSVQKWEIHEVRWVGGCAGAPRRSRAPLAAGQEQRPPVQPRTAGRARAGREAEGTRGLGGSECQPGGPSRLMGKGCAPPPAGHAVQHGALLGHAQLVRLLPRPPHLLQRVPRSPAGCHLPRPLLRRSVVGSCWDWGGGPSLRRDAE